MKIHEVVQMSPLLYVLEMTLMHAISYTARNAIVNGIHGPVTSERDSAVLGNK